MPTRCAVISLCTNLAGSNLESCGLREGGAVRNAMRPVAPAKNPSVGGGEAVLEGPAGFYHALAGNNMGELTDSFSGEDPHHSGTAHPRSRHFVDVPRHAGPDLFGPRLQHRPHRLIARLCEEHDIPYEDVDLDREATAATLVDLTIAR